MRPVLALLLVLCGAGVLVWGLGPGAPSLAAQAQPPERPTLTPAPPTPAPVTPAPTSTPRPDSDDDSPTDEPTATPAPTATSAPTTTPAPTVAATAVPTATPAAARPARLPRTAGSDPLGPAWGLLGLALLGAGLALARRAA